MFLFDVVFYKCQLSKKKKISLLCTKCFCPPPHSYVEALSPNIMIFGDGALWDIIRVRLSHESDLCDWISTLMRTGRWTALSLPCGYMAICKPAKEPHQTQPWSTHVSNFYSPQLWEKCFCYLNHQLCSILLWQHKLIY